MNGIEPSREELGLRLDLLTALSRHGGWQLFTEVLKGAEQSALSRVCSSNDPTELARASGVLKTVKDLSTWLDREIYLTKAHIDSDHI